MSRVLIVNPNTHRSVTRWLAQEARRVAPAGVEIEAINAESGLAALQTPEDVEAAGQAVLRTLSARAGYTGAVVAAFGDPGLAAAQAGSRAPVVGLGECGLRAAGRGGRRFSILTMGAAMRAPIAAQAARLGVGEGLVEIEVLDVAIAHWIAGREANPPQLAHAVRRCRGEAVLLAGAPFAGLAHGVAAETGRLVLDGVAASLARLLSASAP